jgi:chromosome segregation ATPase
MNFLTSGFQELERKARRAAERVRVWLEQRKLTSAEIHLGELGWQQVDFPPEVEREIEAINAMELQQAHISNRGADIQSDIDELQARREENRKAHAEVISGIESAMEPLLQARDVARKPLAANQEGIRRFEHAIAAVQATAETLALQIQELSAISRPGMDVQQQLIELKDRRTECNFEKEDMQRAVIKLQNEIKAQTAKVAALDLQIQDLNLKISDAGDAFNAGDKELLAAIAGLKQGKKETGRQVDRLDKSKGSAYLRVGRCLADFNLAPMNQPESLQRVLIHREIVAGHQQRIAESLEESSRNAAAMRAFYIFIIVLFVAIAIAIVFLFRAPRHAQSGKQPGEFYTESLFSRIRLAHSPMTAMWAEAL